MMSGLRRVARGWWGEVSGDIGSTQSLNDSVQSSERLIDSLSEVVSARELTNGDKSLMLELLMPTPLGLYGGIL